MVTFAVFCTVYKYFYLLSYFSVCMCVHVYVFAQMYLSDVNVLDSEVDKSVIELVDHIWTEATGHLDDVLSVPAHSITPEQVKQQVWYR